MGATDAAGLDVLEAQACGVPAVVDRRDPGGELVSPGETGCVAQRGDAADLADQLKRLLAVPAERRRMGANARAFALQRPWARSLMPVVDAWNEAAYGPATAAIGEYRLSADPQPDETFW
jgi:glycosyltransferase involved in cell wall biosynthesis